MSLIDKRTLIHVQLLPILSGAQRVSLDILGGLDASEWDRHVVTCSDGVFPKYARELGCSTHYCPSMVRPVDIRRDYAAYRNLLRLFRKLHPDIVHTHSSKPGVIGRLAARRAGVKHIVHTVHGFAFDVESAFLKRQSYLLAERTAGRITERLVTVTEGLGETAKRLRISRPGRIRVIRNGTPETEPRREFRRSKLLELTGFAPGAKLVGTVGRLSKQKDIALFLRAAVEVLKREPHARFPIIGEGPEKENLKKLAGRLGIYDAVSFTGFRPDARELMEGLDVFVLTSRWEACSISVLEAMERGLAIVAPPVGGISEMLEDSVSALLPDGREPDGIASAVLEITGAPEMREKLGTAAKSRVRNVFSFSKYIESYRMLYEEILS